MSMRAFSNQPGAFNCVRRILGRWPMTIFYSHQDRLCDASGISLLGALARRAISQASTAFTRIHRTIVAAKTRRMQRELMFGDSSRDDCFVNPDACESNDVAMDAAKFPRQPLILGDKWDF
jgi:hypothetical protein